MKRKQNWTDSPDYIAERKAESPQYLALAERCGRTLVRYSSDILAVLDAKGTLKFINPAMHSLLGFSDSEVLGVALSNLVHPADRRAAQVAIETITPSCPKFKQTWRLLDSGGGVKVFEVSLRNLLPDPDVAGIFVTLHDVTARHLLEGQLVHQAFHDALTGLPNRALFMDRMHVALKRAKRSRTISGLLFLDIVNFKAINDSFGHVEGDRVLVEIATRLIASVRSSDTVARLGGDEFTVLVENCGSEADLAGIAEAIRCDLGQPLTFGGQSAVIIVSIGMAISSSESTPENLLNEADAAMYISKGSQASLVARGRTRGLRTIEQLATELSKNSPGSETGRGRLDSP